MPVYPDRAKFLAKLANLPEGAAKADVLGALGRPDRIESLNPTEETWFYGTDGPKGAATLAQFEIFEGKLAYHPQSLPPPPTSVISEAELRKGLHLIFDDLSKEDQQSNRTDSVWVAKTVNALLPFGESKCKAIIGEAGRLSQGWGFLDPRPFFLCYSLFDPPCPPGYYGLSGLVWDAPTPKDHLAYPRWPVEIVHNVPVIHGQPLGSFGGYAPSFVTSFRELRDRIHLRKSRLSLPGSKILSSKP